MAMTNRVRRSATRTSQGVRNGAKRMRTIVVLLITASFLSLSVSQASATDYTFRFFAGQTLYPGESVYSPNRLYRITMQGDGNLVQFSMPGNKPFWSSGTFRGGSVAQLQDDGNFVIYAPGHVAIWSTNTRNRGNILTVQDDANVVLRAPGNVPVWATNSQNIAGCSDGDRGQAASYASSGRAMTPVPRIAWSDQVTSTNRTVASIELRYFPERRCAWALAGGGTFVSTWIDRSTDGGRTWQGHLGYRDIRTPNTSTYTGVFNDSYPYVVRACASNWKTIRCTEWY